MPIVKNGHRTERIAWGLLLISFALFCTFCITTTLGVHHFFFESKVPLDSVLEVGRGTAVVIDADFAERGVTRDSSMTVPSRINMDSQSQATLSFEIREQTDVTAVAAVNLKNNSTIRLRRAMRPRFDWSSGGYEIELTDFSGQMDIIVLNPSARPLSMRIHTQQGALIQINQNGRYVIDASIDSRVSLTTRIGEAILFAEDQTKNVLVPRGQEGILIATQSQPVTYQARINLLENSIFSLLDMPTNVQGDVPPSIGWGCTNTYVAPPRGTYRPDVWEGRKALRLIRGGDAEANGATRCEYRFADPGWDVRSFNYLELEATFLINYQSLSQCGVAGSECPMMLYIQYEDESGTTREWYQGFYYAHDPQRDYPSRCESCNFGEHRQINSQAWYTFKTGNLFTVLGTAGYTPKRIKSVEFFAEGHEYDVFVGEISLIAGLPDLRDLSNVNGVEAR